MTNLRSILAGKNTEQSRCLGSLSKRSDRFVIVFGSVTFLCLCLGWRKETVGIWTVNKLIFYLVITSGEESTRSTAAKDNLEKACRSHRSRSLQAVSACFAPLLLSSSYLAGRWGHKMGRLHWRVFFSSLIHSTLVKMTDLMDSQNSDLDFFYILSVKCVSFAFSNMLHFKNVIKVACFVIALPRLTHRPFVVRRSAPLLAELAPEQSCELL